jgi:hypothetical protein
MKTFKRNPVEIKTSDLKNYGKYFNQMNFKGISEDDNIYAIDQETFRDANNVYVNSDNKLVSRPTLQKDSLPSEINVYQYELEDVKYIAENTIYINKSKTGSNAYYIVLVDKNGDTHLLPDMADYTKVFKLGNDYFGRNMEISVTFRTDYIQVNYQYNLQDTVEGNYLHLSTQSNINYKEWTVYYYFDQTKGNLKVE